MQRMNEVPVENFSLLDAIVGRRHRLRSEAELAKAIREAADRGGRLALRSAGWSFHDQAQGDDVGLLELPRVVDVHGTGARCSATARWGEVFDRATKAGRLPLVVPTCDDVSIGGSLSADIVSRFSNAAGKEHTQVRELVVMDGLGRRHVLEPARGGEDARLFSAVVGGFGGLGVILEADYEFPTNPFAATPRVENRPHACDEAEMVSRLLEALARPARSAVDERGLPLGVWGISDLAGRCVHFEQRFVDPDTPLRPLVVHQPRSWLHQFGVVATLNDATSRILQGAMYRRGQRDPRPFVDEARGNYFMMDGNRLVRSRLLSAGVRLPLVQQSFVVPVSGAGQSDVARVLEFLDAMRVRLGAAGLEPTVIDHLALPADDHLVSSLRGSRGLMVSISFLFARAEDGHRAREACQHLSADLDQLGGRVHFTKNVSLFPETLRSMYGEALRELAELKARYDPHGVFETRFWARMQAYLSTAGC